MKGYKAVTNILIVIGCVLVFLFARFLFGENPIFYVICPFLGIILYLLSNHFNDKKDKEIDYENRIKKEKLNNKELLSKYTDYLREYRSDNDYNQNEVIIDVLDKVDNFFAKEDALNKIINLNGDKAKSFLEEKNIATQGFIASNLKKLIKALIAYNAQSVRNRPRKFSDSKVVKDILNCIDEISNTYDKLLDEVAKMGDDFNPEDPGLKDLVENLQEIRNANNIEEDIAEDDEIHLFVTSSSSK